jgi:hypothetical protein
MIPAQKKLDGQIRVLVAEFNKSKNAAGLRPITAYLTDQSHSLRVSVYTQTANVALARELIGKAHMLASQLHC